MLFRLNRGALKTFSPAQASQPIEKVDSGRENPRKSKSFGPSSKTHFGAKPRLGGDIQMPDLPLDDVAAIFLAPAPRNPLKTNDRQRFAAENGGKRRPFKRGFRASGSPKAPGDAANGVEALAGGHSTEPDRVTSPVLCRRSDDGPARFTFRAKSGCARCVHLLWSSPQFEDKR
jgi:hypothetical protein